MINVIVPIVSDVEKFSTFIKGNKKNGVKFFVGIKQSLAKKFVLKSKNVDVHIFSDKANREEIINALHSVKKEKGKILIARRPLSENEFVSLTTSQKEIAVLKKHHNKFVNGFKRIAMNIIKKVFAFSYFDDISAICYAESMFELLSVCQNLSMASRINKYVGVEIEEIETKEKQVKKEFNKIRCAMKFLLGCLIFLGSVAGVVCVCLFCETPALIIILIVAWLIVALTIWLISLVNLTRTVAVGDLQHGRAEEIKKGEKI